MFNFILDRFPFEKYYKFMELFKRYFNKIIRPAIFQTILIGFIYFIGSNLFKIEIRLEVFFFIFIALVIYDIIMGCLYGESIKEFYLKDD
jgi:hypothetical protein